MIHNGPAKAEAACHPGARVAKTRAMRTEIDHLPSSKQRELVRVVQIVFEEFEEFEDTLAFATNEWKKMGRGC